MSTNPNHGVLRATGIHVSAVKSGDPDRIADAKRGITEAKLERAIRAAIAAAPPLTPDTRERLAHLLRTGGQD